jgi:hypothetical protein
MRQGRLGDVQDIRRPRKAAGFVDCLDGAQVTQLDMHMVLSA